MRWKPLGVDSRLSTSARADIWFPEEDVTTAIATTNPVTGEVLKEFDELRPEELEDKLSRAAAAAASYRLTSVEQLAGWLARAAELLDRESQTVNELITTEIGKTLRSAGEEVTKCVAALRFYSERGPEFLRASRGAAEAGADQTYVSYQPLGVVLAIMPWNFPLWQGLPTTSSKPC